MIRIRKEYIEYTVLFLLVILFIMLLSSCDGVTPTSYTIISMTEEGGSISPSGEIAVSEGGSLTFTITPEENYQIYDVLVDGASVGAFSTYTFTDVVQNHTIRAMFDLSSNIYNVDSKVGYATIQEAIDVALDGETIIVYPGTYYENILFNGRNITLRSSDPLDPVVVASTIINGGGSSSVGQFTGGDTSTLEGLTIRNGNFAVGGGIMVNQSSPTITGNTITNNQGIKGGGIYIYDSSPTITGNTITHNQGDMGGGIHILESSPTITDNSITDNTASAAGGGIYMDQSSPTITGNTITDNQANSGGGGILIQSSSPNISRNGIISNQAYYGGGICMTQSSSTITGNTFTDNEAYVGGGMYVYQGSNLLPDTDRPTGWATTRENIPIGSPLYPAEGVEYEIAGNTFLGNEHSSPLCYTEGAHVYFD